MSSQASSSPPHLLYLANYAPIGRTEGTPDDSEGRKYSRYHREMLSLLESLGFMVTSARNVKPLIDHFTEYDYVFSLLNRAPYRGSEILVSALCEYFKIPYLGARPNVRAVAEDKYLAKLVAKQLGFEVPAGQVYRASDLEITSPTFRGPYIAKPRCGASSKHITEGCIQDLWDDLVPEVRRLLELGDDVLVEEWIPGTNVTLPVIGGTPPLVLPAYQLDSVKKGQLVSYEQKRGTERGVRRIEFDNELVINEMNRLALILYADVQPIDYLRLDFRVTSLNRPVFLEFNVCCNIGPQSGFSACAEQRGFSHREMLIRILNHSFKRQEINWQAL
jgi:D-alanine-D-alanine ligase